MKSQRWNSSSSLLLSKQEFRDELKTERQWAKEGFLPLSEDCGEKLRPNSFSTGDIKELPRYLLPEEVRAADKDELCKYFEPERKRKAAQAVERKQKFLREQEQSEREQHEYIRQLQWGVKNLIDEQHKIVRYITQAVPLPSETSEVIVIDTETTGLSPNSDEILQLSIINDKGETLFDSNFHPLLHKLWDEAQAVNGISPEMVADAPTFAEKAAEIQRIINSADTLIGYNSYFDVDFMRAAGIIIPARMKIIDIMPMFAEIYGEWSEKYSSYKWQKLTTCAEYFHYDWSSTMAHNSLADCFATLYCYKKITTEQKANTYKAERKR